MSNERDAYVEKFKAQLDHLNAKIDVMEAKANEAKADAKIKYERELRQLREKRDTARSKLAEVHSASGEAWKDLKSGFERSWDALSESVKHATERFK